jgi:hypothetical protein
MMQHSLCDELIAVRDVFSQPGTWTRFCLARNQNDEATEPENPGAVKWCLLGALERWAPKFNDEIQFLIANEIDRTDCWAISLWNDEIISGPKEVVNMFESLIKKEQYKQLSMAA